MNPLIWISLVFNLLFPPKIVLIQPVLAQSYTTSTKAETLLISPNKGQISLSPQAVRAFVYSESVKMGVNPVKSLWIIDHESEDCWQEGYYDPALRGDDGISVGCWQFNIKVNKNVDISCAEDLTCSTDLALSWILKGKISEWSTWRFRKAWYENAPD